MVASFTLPSSAEKISFGVLPWDVSFSIAALSSGEVRFMRVTPFNGLLNSLEPAGHTARTVDHDEDRLEGDGANGPVVDVLGWPEEQTEILNRMRQPAPRAWIDIGDEDRIGSSTSLTLSLRYHFENGHSEPNGMEQGFF